MAAFTAKTWPTWCAPGVIGSSQGRLFFTAPIPKAPCAGCATSRLRPPRSGAEFDLGEFMIMGNSIRYFLALAALAALTTSCGIRRHPYENPFTKDTQQPDKVLFDKAIHDIEHSRYEI